ncbi:hypothetical protein SK128_004493, partial [Halocaridina rubra]
LAYGLRITRVEVPGPLVTGEGGYLDCEWELEDDSVYAVKWYMGLAEFYRWTPAETPSVKTFQIPGDPIKVDLPGSHQGKVRIHQVTLEAGGVYRCEVSAEAPSFHTESAVALMTVVDLPDSKPRISGAQMSYQMEEEVMLNCTSLNSRPAASLTFYINDEQADPFWLVHYESIKDPTTGLETAVLGLKFPLWPRLLRRGTVNVKCTAEISNLYFDSSEILVAGDIPYHASIMEDRESALLPGSRANPVSLETTLSVITLILVLM